MVRRKAGALMPLELEILDTGMRLIAAGEEPYGFLLAKRLADGRPGPLVAHGTLYKALARLVAAGMLESSWEDPAAAEEQGRPRRRLYRVTGAGERAVEQAAADARDAAPGVLRPAGGAA